MCLGEGSAMLPNLKKLRNSMGLTQAALAEKLGTNQQTIHKYENMQTEPDVSTLIRLADCFYTSVDFLVGHKIQHPEGETTRACDLNEQEIEIIEHFRLLSTDQKNALNVIIDTFLKDK